MKTRLVRTMRTVPHTRNGHTELVPERVEEIVPAAPADWDAIAYRIVVGAIGVLICGVVMWSTVAIGSLLSNMAPPWAAYTVAVAFDLSWICCMLLEWVARHDQKRARIPMVAGLAMLAVSMTMVILDGHEAGHTYIGVAGAAVSALVKGLWTVAMRFSSVKLDEKDEAWLRQRRVETGLRMALVAEQRREMRETARIESHRAALGLPQRIESEREDVAEAPEDRPQSIASFVRELMDANPDASRERIRALAIAELGSASRAAIDKAYLRAKK